MAKKLKTEVHTDNGPPPSALSGRVSRSSSGDRRVPLLRKSSMVWIWQHGKRTGDYRDGIFSCVRPLYERDASDLDKSVHRSLWV